ncbi:heme-binding protein [Streptomyces sp. NPDC058955]|uniref:heme-binding protein n=1 Tax=unclassified Streptomyces TaxID=2593676 RepID=UPI0036479E4D
MTGGHPAGRVRRSARAGGFGRPAQRAVSVRRGRTRRGCNAATTSVLVGRLEQNPTLAAIPNTLFLAGGLPIHHQGSPIAGIGVAGAPSGLQDEQFAHAGIDALAH